MTEVIKNVTDALGKAAEGQRMASEAIATTNNDIKVAEDVLNKVHRFRFFVKSCVTLE